MLNPDAKTTVLLAEDELAVRNFVQAALARNGFLVLSTRNGKEAVAMSRNYPGAIDVLLSDVRMPGMDGIEAAQIIQEERPEIRVLLMSGETSGTLPSHLPAALIRKPFLPMVLLERVRHLMACRQTRPADGARAEAPSKEVALFAGHGASSRSAT